MKKAIAKHYNRAKPYTLSTLLFVAFFLCSEYLKKPDKTIIIQPFHDFPLAEEKSVYTKLKLIYPNIILRPAIQLPPTAYYEPRNRYRADSIVNYLSRSQLENPNTIIIGLTSKDISATKGNIIDWGIMGLADCPGNACVVSIFRVSKNQIADELYKLAIHELAHTQGLPHCSNKTCFMRDAEGGNHLNEEKDFCPSCKAFLKSKGWRFN